MAGEMESEIFLFRKMGGKAFFYLSVFLFFNVCSVTACHTLKNFSISLIISVNEVAGIMSTGRDSMNMVP